MRVTIKIIPSAGNDPKDFQQDLDKIGALLRSILGENCVIAHEFVNEIPPTKSGKYLHTVCKIPTADRGSQRGGQVGPANQKVVL